MPQSLATKQTPVCPDCLSPSTIRKGHRRNRLRLLRIFQCTECKRRFTDAGGKGRTYPLKTILDAVSTFNLGHSMTDTQRILRRRTHLDVPERTIRSWLTAYKSLATYARLRPQGAKLFNPDQLIKSFTLYHQQVYRFQFHRAKLELLLQSPPHLHFAAVKAYLSGVDRHFPHRLFQSNEHRSSKLPAHFQPPVSRKENHATKLAALALPTAPTNKKRHEILQRFMLINDSVTIAAEIPVYLTREDIAYYRSRGFNLGFAGNIITGHIDFLQIRNGYLHILDYKPEARKEKHAHVQLTIYALALSRRTHLPLKAFKCAWFDDQDYFEFFPLQGVYVRKD